MDGGPHAAGRCGATELMGAAAPSHIAALFATPVVFDELEDAARLNGELQDAIIDQRNHDDGLKLSNRGGWQSRHDFEAWSGQAGKQLIEHAKALASQHTATTAPAGPRWMVDSWANVSETGAFNMPHVHGGTFWSCVYYVSVGHGEGGRLLLHDPRMPGLRMHAPDYRFREMGPEGFAPIKPKAGLMVLFPGWVSHHVEPWHGTGTRISVAMNIRAVQPAQSNQQHDQQGTQNESV